MDITNVVSDAELEDRLDALCRTNPLVETMIKSFNQFQKYPKTAREYIDMWFVASRESLMRELSIREHELYKGLYIDSSSNK